MSQKSVYKTPKAYKPRKLVSGFCIPAKEGSGESLICHDCYNQHVAASGFPVTYDGKVRCSRCNEFLKPVG